MMFCLDLGLEFALDGESERGHSPLSPDSYLMEVRIPVFDPEISSSSHDHDDEGRTGLRCGAEAR